jgi:hypothetical protein
MDQSDHLEGRRKRGMPQKSKPQHDMPRGKGMMEKHEEMMESMYGGGGSSRMRRRRKGGKKYGR